MDNWNRQVIEEFRANGGRVEQFGDQPLVILHTIGARTGQIREIPLATYVEGGTMTVFATKGGAPTNPDWYHNLKRQPVITVETGDEQFEAELVELSAGEASRRIMAHAEHVPQMVKYVESAAPRRIPAFEIRRR